MGELGINGLNFIVQLIAFALFIVIFWKLALGPIVRTLDDRRNTIRESVEAAERMQTELKATQARNEEILAEARRDAQQIIANAREVSEQNIARSREQAQVQADDMLEKARLVIANETSQARAELRQEVANLAVDIADKVIQTNLDRNGQLRLIEEALAEANRRSVAGLN
jgi:F-type H+-transporting ATPase subunit b